MSSVALVVLCFLLGAAGRAWLALPDQTPKVLNTWVIWVSLPALVLRVVHQVPLDGRLVLGASALWLVFGVAAVAGVIAVRRGADRPVVGALVLCAGLGNTSFVGLPLLEVLGGPAARGSAAVVDQLGSFFAFALGAVPFAAWLTGQSTSVGAVLGRVARFPPFWALVVAVALHPVPFPAVVDGVLGRLADMLTPLALASVGFQLDLSAFVGNGAKLGLGLTYKLLVAPALAWGYLALTAPGLGPIEQIAVCQAGMAPMATAGVLALEFGLAPRVASALIALGVPLSFLTVWGWWQVAASWS